MWWTCARFLCPLRPTVGGVCSNSTLTLSSIVTFTTPDEFNRFLSHLQFLHAACTSYRELPMFNVQSKSEGLRYDTVGFSMGKTTFVQNIDTYCASLQLPFPSVLPVVCSWHPSERQLRAPTLNWFSQKAPFRNGPSSLKPGLYMVERPRPYTQAD